METATETIKNFIFSTFEEMLAAGNTLDVRTATLRYLEQNIFNEADIIKVASMIEESKTQA